MLQVKPTGQSGRAEVAETATKPSLAVLRKQSLGGCTIDGAGPVELPSSEHIVLPHDILLSTGSLPWS